MNLMAGVCLLIQGIWDVRTKEIPTCISLGLGICGFLYSVCCYRNWSCFCMALIPGIICLFLGFCTRQAVGYGDGILLCALAMLYKLEDLLYILMIAILFAGVIGLCLLVFLKKKGTYEIPFVPFLFVGWLCFYGVRMVERGIM